MSQSTTETRVTHLKGCSHRFLEMDIENGDWTTSSKRTNTLPRMLAAEIHKQNRTGLTLQFCRTSNELTHIKSLATDLSKKRAPKQNKNLITASRIFVCGVCWERKKEEEERRKPSCSPGTLESFVMEQDKNASQPNVGGYRGPHSINDVDGILLRFENVNSTTDRSYATAKETSPR